MFTYGLVFFTFWKRKTKNENMSDTTKRIKMLRKSLGFTQEQLGKAAGVSKAAVSQWERGITKPERDSLLEMQHKLKVNPVWITENRGEMFLPANGTKEEFINYVSDGDGNVAFSTTKINTIVLIDENHRNINKAWTVLSQEGRAAVLVLAEHLIKAQGKPSEETEIQKKPKSDHSLGPNRDV